MERRPILFDAENSQNGKFVRTELTRLHPGRRSNSIFEETTPVEIHASELNIHAREYSLLIGKPVRSKDLEKILRDSSELEYNAYIAINRFLDDEEDEFGSEVQTNLHLLGELLESPDDSGFLTELSGRLKTHEQAWKDVVSQRGFAVSLAQQIDLKNPDSELLDIARNVIDVMRKNPYLWTDRERSIGQTKNETLLDRFVKLTPIQRSAILEVEMERFEDKNEEQRKRIRLTDGIQCEWDVDGKTWYLVGNRGDVEQVREHEYVVASGNSKAGIRMNQHNVDIFPQSAFLLPTLTWINDNGRRRLVVPSKFEKEYMTIPVQSKPNVRFQYKIDPRQMSNPMMGLVACQYILNFAAFKDSPPEDVPERAAMRSRIHEILQSDLIRNAEKEVGI